MFNKTDNDTTPYLPVTVTITKPKVKIIDLTAPTTGKGGNREEGPNSQLNHTKTDLSRTQKPKRPKSFNISSVETPYMLEPLGLAYSGLTVGHLIFTMDLTESTNLTKAVAHWCQTLASKENHWHKTIASSIIDKMYKAEVRCQRTLAHMQKEDEAVQKWLNDEREERNKRFLASLGAFAVGGAITFAAEEIAHLFQTSGNYNNEKLLAQRIERTDHKIRKIEIRNNDISFRHLEMSKGHRPIPM